MHNPLDLDLLLATLAYTGIGVAEPPDAAGVYYFTQLFVLDPS